MKDELFYVTIAVTFAILVLGIIKAERAIKGYEIRYIHGWFVIVDKQTDTYLKRFKTLEEAKEYFNENCK